MSALLALEDVEARYGPVQALHGVSLEVPRGRDRGGARRERRGEDDDAARDLGHRPPVGDGSTFAGKPLRGGPEAVARAGIAHVPEGRGTFIELTVTENLRLGAYTRRDRSRQGGHRRGSSEYFPWMPGARATSAPGRSPAASSRCSRSARALMARPRLLLLDEPSLGLAPMIVREIFRIVRELNEKEGLTVLVVEQDARIALQAVARARTCSRSAASRSRGRATSCARTSPSDGATSGTDGRRRLRRLHAAGRRPGSPRAAIYALARARARDHPPLDRGHQLRAGRDGDALDVHRLDADREPRLELLARVRRHAGRSRSSGGVGDPPGRDPAGRAGSRAARS